MERKGKVQDLSGEKKEIKVESAKAPRSIDSVVAISIERGWWSWLVGRRGGGRVMVASAETAEPNPCKKGDLKKLTHSN